VRWLLDEIVPPATAGHLRRLGHDAVSVLELGMAGATDDQVFSLAVSEARVVVTENFADYSVILQRCLDREEPCVPVVYIRRSAFPRRGALASRLAAHLDKWAAGQPSPYIGPHWPR